jgi:hypothetical protein
MGGSVFHVSPTTSPRFKPPPLGQPNAMEQLTQADVLAGEMAGGQDVTIGEEFLSDSE